MKRIGVIIFSLFAVLLLTACTNTKTYTVIFETNGGTKVDEVLVAEGELLDVKETTKEGFEFGGWYLNETFIGEPWNFETDKVSKDLTLYAKFEEHIYYTVSFETNGGTEVLDIRVRENGLLTEVETEKSDYNFKGWYLDENFVGEPWNFKTDKVSKDLTLYAKFEEHNYYTVSFETNGGTEVLDIKVRENETMGDINSVLIGYVLEGFYTDPDFEGNAWNLLEDKVTEDIKLYAQFLPIIDVRAKVPGDFRGQLDNHEGVNNAETIGLEPSYFFVKSFKGSTGNNVGVYDEFRFYAGSKLEISLHESFLLDEIKFSNHSNFTVTVDGKEVTSPFRNLKGGVITIYNKTKDRQDVNYFDISYYQVGEDVLKEDDINRPKIDIKGYQLIELLVGDIFNVPTLTATDLEDGEVDVTFETDNVNINEYGIYYAHFIAIDSDDNITRAYITIIVREVNKIENYYNGVTEGLNGDDLKDVLADILNDTLNLRNYEVGNNALGIIDRDPNNFDNVLLIYNSASIRGGWTGGINWAKEHVWAKSAFGSALDGKNQSISGTPTGYNGIGSDLHNLRAINPSVNSTHSNLMFTNNKGNEGLPFGLVGIDRTQNNPFTPGKENDYTDKAFYPGDEHIGDVARILLYMNVVWGIRFREDVDMLIDWHLQDPVDSFEIIRNELIFTYQGNRNPFIDYPELAERVYVN